MSFEEVAVRNRTFDYAGTLYESDGTTEISLAATDVIRVKVWRRNASTPDIEIDDSATGNGSVTTFTAGTGDYTLRIAQGDTSGLLPGVYGIEIAVVDDSETAPANAIKHVEQGLLHITEAPAGDVGLT